MTKRKDPKDYLRQGRPPIYDPEKPEDLEKYDRLSIEYFEHIKGEQDEEGNYTRYPEPPTVTGLTLYMGFSSKDTLYEYAKKPDFSDPTKRALAKIEQFHEIQAARGDKCTGNIFILKNFGWKDKVEHDITGKQEIIWKEEKTYETK